MKFVKFYFLTFSSYEWDVTSYHKNSKTTNRELITKLIIKLYGKNKNT